MTIYPIKFEPILQEKIWGGSKLETLLNKNSHSKNIGESWEISGVPGNISQVSNGDYKGLSLVELLEEHTINLVGKKNYNRFGNEFPLLIKFLDAKTNLSVQVHPDDEMARKKHNSYGKTEMWYIMDHDEDAEIIVGLKNHNLSKKMLQEVNSDNVSEIFNQQKVKKGESFFIPAGEVHAIGAGVLAAEIQQTSDITYRVYDWDRTDAHGHSRELHLEESLEAIRTQNINYEMKHSNNNNKITNLVTCDYFTTNKLTINQSSKKSYETLDSFVIYMCLEGAASVTINHRSEIISKGETLLIPSAAKEVFLFAEQAELLEVFI